jgi:hypothetical protein
MIAVVDADTGELVIANVALVLPAGTVTVEGTETADESLLRDTELPPRGAIPAKVTVPWDVLPPKMLDGFKLIVLKKGSGD